MTAASPRRVTQPRRRFGEADLAALTRRQRRQLCQVLLTESGAQLAEYNAPAAYDELVVEIAPLWAKESIRVRIATRLVSQSDVDRLNARMIEAGDAASVYIAPLGTAEALTVPARVMLLTARDLLSRLERSASIAWPDDVPAPAIDRIEALRGLDRDAALVDLVGLRWLPILALNELPVELAGTEHAPEDLLERFAFRIFTGTFRFGGSRFGEAMRGERLADGLLTWPAGSGSRFAALLDCKAASGGYVMESDHVLRFQRYVADIRGGIEESGRDLRYVIVLSSSFPGRPSRHPFHGRARELRKSGVELAYVRALDLAQLAVSVETLELPPEMREGLDWASILNEGLVLRESLMSMLVSEGA